MFKFMLFFTTLFILVGCGDDEVVIDETLPVTTYFAIEDELGNNEWQYFITITINSEHVVTHVELNGITQLANRSRREVAQLDDYEDVFGYNFYEQVSSLEQSLIGTLRDDLADAIRDAYHDGIVDFDTTTFADLVHRALSTGALPLERGPYIDGTYHGIDVVDEDGLQYFVNLFVINGDIVAVHFNALSGDGLKYNPFTATTVDDEIIAWRTQARLLEQALIQLQDPMAFTFSEDGFTSDIPGVDIEIESFVSLVTQALAAGPVVIAAEE